MYKYIKLFILIACLYLQCSLVECELSAMEGHECQDMKSPLLDISDSIPFRNLACEVLACEIPMQHLICDFVLCVIADDAILLEKIMRKAALKAGAKSLEFVYHKFEPDGISAILVLAESHISLHYWFEHKYAAIDVFTCGKCEPENAIDYLKKKLAPSFTIVNRVDRPGL